VDYCGEPIGVVVVEVRSRILRRYGAEPLGRLLRRERVGARASARRAPGGGTDPTGVKSPIGWYPTGHRRFGGRAGRAGVG
jgi:hypothetical protein